MRPEVIILSALLVANKFLNDAATHTTRFRDVAEGRWTCDQINVTERCILENLGWRVMPLWREELIEDAKEEMRWAGMAVRGRRVSAQVAMGRQVSGGAMWTAQGQLTPVESPVDGELAC